MPSNTQRVKSSFFDSKTPPHIITLVLIAGMGALNMNILLPSLPGMTDYFNTEYAVMQLAVSAYLAGTAVAQIFIGPMSDRYGRRSVMLFCILVFIIGTVICLFAKTIEVFMLGRMIQTLIATGMVISRAVIRDMVPGNEAASMIGYVTMGMAVVPMIGPSIGGYLDQTYNWQASFMATLTLASITLAVVYFNMGETCKAKPLSVGDQLRAYGSLLRSRRFWGYALTAAFAAGAFFAFLGASPYLATELFHMSPMEQGASFFFTAFGYMIGNFLSGRYSARFGNMKMIMTGGVVATAGIAFSVFLFLIGIDHLLAFFIPTIFLGLGNGLTMPNANAGMVSVRPDLAGAASGLGGALMVGGGAALAAVAGNSLGPDTGPFPLLYLMLFSLVASMITAAYVRHIDEKMA